MLRLPIPIILQHAVFVVNLATPITYVIESMGFHPMEQETKQCLVMAPSLALTVAKLGTQLMCAIESTDSLWRHKFHNNKKSSNVNNLVTGDAHVTDD